MTPTFEMLIRLSLAFPMIIPVIVISYLVLILVFFQIKNMLAISFKMITEYGINCHGFEPTYKCML